MEVDFPWHAYFGDEIGVGEQSAEPLFHSRGVQKGRGGEEEGVKERGQVVGT